MRDPSLGVDVCGLRCVAVVIVEEVHEGCASSESELASLVSKNG